MSYHSNLSSAKHALTRTSHRPHEKTCKLFCSSYLLPLFCSFRLSAVQHEGRNPRDLCGVHGAHVELPHGRPRGIRSPVRPDPGGCQESTSRGVLHIFEVEPGTRFRRIYEKVARNVLLAVRTLPHIHEIGWLTLSKWIVFPAYQSIELDNARTLLSCAW